MKTNNKSMKNYFLALCTLITLINCGNESETKAYKPHSVGTQGIIEIILDEQLWEGRLGEIIQNQVAPMIPYYPNEEYLFDLQHSTKKAFDMSPKKQRYIIQFIVNPNISIKPTIDYAKDVWASSQSLIRIIGRNQQDLYDVFMANSEDIKNHFTQLEIQRLSLDLKADQNYYAKQELKKKHNLSLTIPSEMELSINNDNFAAFQHLRLVSERQKSPGDVQQFILVYHYPYTNKSQLTKEALLAKRDSVVKKYFRGVTDESYMITAPDSLVPSFEKEILFKGAYAFEIRGLYSMVKDFRGGPFINISLVDEERGRIVTIEGHAFCPKFAKRPYMMELETILNSLSFE